MPEPDGCAEVCVMLKSPVQRSWMSDQPATFCLRWLGSDLRRVFRENGDRDCARVLDMKPASTRGGFRVASLGRFDDIAEFGEAGCKPAGLGHGRGPPQADPA